VNVKGFKFQSHSHTICVGTITNAPFLGPKVDPSVLPTFVPLESCSLILPIYIYIVPNFQQEQSNVCIEKLESDSI
jgi:hypothetical protein